MREIIKYFPLDISFWSGIIGAVLGAVIGGIIAYVIQIRVLSEARALREIEKLDRNRGIATSIMLKIRRVHGNFHHIGSHIKESIETASNNEAADDPWRFIFPFLNFPDELYFSNDEIGLIISAEKTEITNFIIDLDMIHNGLIAAIKVLSEKKIALMEEVDPSSVDGQIVEFKIDKEKLLKLRPRMNEINDIIKSIYPDIENKKSELEEIIPKIHKILKQKTKLNFELKL